MVPTARFVVTSLLLSRPFFKAVPLWPDLGVGVGLQSCVMVMDLGC